MIRFVSNLFNFNRVTNTELNQEALHFENQIKKVLTYYDSIDKLVLDMLKNKLTKYITIIRLDKLDSFVICVCYIKFQIHNNNSIELDSILINIWLRNIVGYPIEIPKEFIKKIKITKEHLLIDHSKFKVMPIKLAKLAPSYYQTVNIHATSKPDKLKIDTIYCNADSVCFGAVKKLASIISTANLLPKLSRINMKNKYVKSLEANQHQQLINKNLLVQFKNLQGRGTMYHDFGLVHTQDLYYNAQTLFKGLCDIVTILKENNLNHIYCQVLTAFHAKLLVISKSGVGIKWTLYDPDIPNSKELYVKSFLYLHEIRWDNTKITKLLTKITESQNLSKEYCMQILLKCYTKELNCRKSFKLVKNDLEKHYSPQEKWQLLMLGLCTFNNTLVEHLLKNFQIETGLSYNKFTPLLQAIYLNNSEAVRLLLEYGASCNLSADNGMSPLSGAISRGCSLQIIMLLVNHKNIEISTLEKTKLKNKYKIEV